MVELVCPVVFRYIAKKRIKSDSECLRTNMERKRIIHYVEHCYDSPPTPMAYPYS